jgi:hypoxanthine phosphoribosyltransferase
MSDSLRLTWADFDEAVATLAPMIYRPTAKRLYGVPRGGLSLAVALSHQTGIPLAIEPGPDCLIVDDIADTGTTLRRFTGAQMLVWVFRPRSLVNVRAALRLTRDDDRWVLFPWEKESNADQDRDRYSVRRPM